MTVQIETRDGIALVTIDNPPVNATGHAVRQGLSDAVARTEGDSAVRAVVLACAGRTFIAGADIREFGQPLAAPHLPDVLARIAGARKPWVAAIHGTALGGGLETALACHYRIAAPGAALGLPEVTLGLIPGAGGTVRLPRLITVDRALDMIASGTPVPALRARELGLIDAIAGGDLVSDALAFAREVADRPLPAPLDDRPPRPESAEGALKAVAARHTDRARGQRAPLAAIEALRNAQTLPVAEALNAERALFQALRDGAQSKALRHIFFAERAAGRVDRLKGIAPRPLDHIGVIGGGTMGAGIAAACLIAGLSVTMIERDADAAEAGRARVAGILDGARKRGKLTPEDHAVRLAAFAARDNYEALAEADLVIEAVFEDMDVKHAVFAALDGVTRPDAVLASNTSYLDVAEIARAADTPARVLGLHFFAPAHIMKLLEIVTPEGLDDSALATGLALAKRLGKIPVIAGVCDGFIANRIMSRYRREAEYMLEDGALPWEIDAAMENYGFAMGIFRMQDLSGLDISWAMRKRRAATRDPAERYVDIGDRLCEAGHFGQKTGRGYYRYGEDGRAQRSAETEALILAESARKGIARQPVPETEIMARLLAAMQDEGACVLDEGIAQSAADIDVVIVNAFGFPRWKGGPMFAGGA
ncbi:3-hydroxyacyl-CoA dehydrogenase NAD-binding domain-containing protein [Roseovarius autotrophicus]|uniref:3-hydroxyacyl-CoA dehydrogenase NAD-binding domain-containing protein n=1 Tax=Roseovarius autotrophicus TaxID=2824121 RepID=UPI001B38A549|nr:3-hydroxyacyl-CoA dehydrogenase NAD-binding domain-containing protein [Roseovarius autotrophicus]